MKEMNLCKRRILKVQKKNFINLVLNEIVAKESLRKILVFTVQVFQFCTIFI